MSNSYSKTIKIPISIKIPIKVVRFSVAAKAKEVKLISLSFWRSLKSSLALILGVMLIIGSLPALSAYEAHVVSVTATILADPPALGDADSNLVIDPPQDGYCSNKSIEVSLATSLADAQIIYTLDGGEPSCGSYGYIYDRPFFLTESTVVKASTCIAGGEQGKIVSWNFKPSDYSCNDNSAVAADSLNAPLGNANTAAFDTASSTADTATSTDQILDSQNGTSSQPTIDGAGNGTTTLSGNSGDATTTENSQPDSGTQQGTQISPDQQPAIQPPPAIEPPATIAPENNPGTDSAPPDTTGTGGADSGQSSSSGE